MQYDSYRVQTCKTIKIYGRKGKMLALSLEKQSQAVLVVILFI